MYWKSRVDDEFFSSFSSLSAICSLLHSFAILPPTFETAGGVELRFFASVGDAKRHGRRRLDRILRARGRPAAMENCNWIAKYTRTTHGFAICPAAFILQYLIPRFFKGTRFSFHAGLISTCNLILTLCFTNCKFLDKRNILSHFCGAPTRNFSTARQITILLTKDNFAEIISVIWA